MTKAHSPLLLGVALVAAGVNFCWGLGSSSLFGDEVWTLRAAGAPLGEVFDAVRATEVASPLYYWLLHGWIELIGSTSEAAIRAPSVVAGVGLVGAAWWLGGLVAGWRAAFLAALLTALSPLVLLYAQQARAYIFAALMVCVSVAAMLQAERGAQCRRWLTASVVTAALSIWFHYTAALVVIPLAIYALVWSTFRLRSRVTYGAACAVAGLVVLPLALDQVALHPATILLADLRLSTLSTVFSVPFDTRTYLVELVSPRLLGAAAVVAAGLAWWRWGRRGRDAGSWGLLTAAALVPPLVLVVAGVLGANTMIGRYAAVAVGPMIVLIAAASTVAPWRPKTALLTAALSLALIGTVAQHRRDGFWPDARGAVAYVAEQWRSDDVLVIPSPGVAVRDSLQHYATGRLPAQARIVSGQAWELEAPNIWLPAEARAVNFESPGLSSAIAQGRRLWTVTGPLRETEYSGGSSPVGYQPAQIARFAGSRVLQVTLAVSVTVPDPVLRVGPLN